MSSASTGKETEFKPETEVKPKAEVNDRTEQTVEKKGNDLHVDVSNVHLGQCEMPDVPVDGNHEPEGNDNNLVNLYRGEPYTRFLYPMVHYSREVSSLQYDAVLLCPSSLTDGEGVERAWVSALTEHTNMDVHEEQIGIVWASPLNGQEIVAVEEGDMDEEVDEGMPALIDVD
ncbi:hypothetical protein V5O48_013483 [Marasmius crinis-equi]|uniref:Uncharacterized protein n=1 Tax=Marasmius crinis-equi TaxID=585013 RepID=A0ABR3F025_9AGAR